MRELDVRRSLHAALVDRHADDGSLVLDELGVGNGRRRVDVAVINGELTGYEIKSAADRLDRLPGQTDLYNKLFDRMWLVVADRHLDDACELVPNWWGVAVATPSGDGVRVDVVREAELNADEQDALTVAQLLWRDEALELLDRYEIGDSKLRRGSRRHMYVALAERLPLRALKGEVREILKSRKDWR